MSIVKLPEIIGVAGTNGSGKDTLASLRAEKQKCLQVTVSDILRRHLTNEGVSLERKHLSDLSRQWRDESGDHGVLVTRTIQSYLGERALLGLAGLSVVSLRHPAEAMRVKEHGGIVLWVDAEPYKRYQRVSASQRGRVDDNKTFDEFLIEEGYDMNPGEDADPASVNMRAVREVADVFIVNNYNNQEDYAAHLEKRFEIK